MDQSYNISVLQNNVHYLEKELKKLKEEMKELRRLLLSRTDARLFSNAEREGKVRY